MKEREEGWEERGKEGGGRERRRRDKLSTHFIPPSLWQVSELQQSREEVERERREGEGGEAAAAEGARSASHTIEVH